MELTRDEQNSSDQKNLYVSYKSLTKNARMQEMLCDF